MSFWEKFERLEKFLKLVEQLRKILKIQQETFKKILSKFKIDKKFQ